MKKYELAMEMSPPPDTLIVGSSRVMTMRPADVEMRLGGRAFNWGVPSATAEDYYASVRLFSETLGIRLNTVIVAVDLEAFNPAEPLMAEARYFPKYADFLSLSPEAGASFAERATLLVSMQQTGESLSVVKRALRRETGFERTRIEPDGYVFQAARERAIAEGAFDLGETIAGRVRKYPERSLKLERYTHADERRIEYLRMFLEYCRDNDIRVYAYIAPYHPQLWDVLKAIPGSGRLRNIADNISRVFARHNVTLYDFSRLEYFGGDASRFYDEIHPMPDLQRQILSVLLEHEAKNISRAGAAEEGG